MIRNAIWLAALGLSLVGGSALADDTAVSASVSVKKAHHGGYGTAGCGLGSIIIGTSPGIVQIFAATFNGTGSQTFGITSGTSNCADPAAGDETARVFVQANRVALARDISRGAGETIDDLAAIEGCSDSKAVATTLQRNFKVIFPSGSASGDQVTDAITTTLKSDASLACTGLGG